MCAFVWMHACMNACVNMRPCMVHDIAVYFHMWLCLCVCCISWLSSSLSIRHSVSWTPSQTGLRKESDLTPDCPFGGRGSWSMSAPLRLHFPSVSFLFFPWCQAQTLKTSTLIGPSQRELLFRLSNCDPRCQPGPALTECLQTNSTIVFPSPALGYSSVAPLAAWPLHLTTPPLP